MYLGPTSHSRSCRVLELILRLIVGSSEANCVSNEKSFSLVPISGQQQAGEGGNKILHGRNDGSETNAAGASGGDSCEWKAQL